MGQRQHTRFIPFADNSNLRISELKIFHLEREGFTGTQAIQQHQTHQSEIAKRMKAVPERGDLLGGERHNNSLGLLQAQPQRYGATWPAVTERGSLRISALEVGLAGGNLCAQVESIQAMQDDQAVIYGLGRGLRLLVELIADVIEQGRFSDLG